ncbi:MAG: hypothetical protein V1701_02975 [Planctomycetota bacterium]
MWIVMKNREEIRRTWLKEHPYYAKGQYVPPRDMQDFYGMLLAIAGRKIKVETDYLFADQFNTVPIRGISDSGLRVHENYVAQVIDDERHGKMRCGWCGKTSAKSAYCPYCKKYEYLQDLYSNPVYTMTTQKEVRDSFWTGMSPLYREEYHPSKRQNEYSADIRMAWVGYIDDLARSGEISESLARRVTL